VSDEGSGARKVRALRVGLTGGIASGKSLVANMFGKLGAELLDAVKTLGPYLSAQLAATFGANPNVGDIRGRGLFMAIELVADRASKRAFDPGVRVHARILSEAMMRGLVVYPMGGTIDGSAGDHVLIAPPFIATADDIDEIVRRLGGAVDATLAAVA